MATVVHRTTFEVRRSVSTPDYPTAIWLINPQGLQGLINASVPSRYWKIVSEDLEEMTQSEKDAVDNSLLASDKIQATNSLLADYEEYIPSRYSNAERDTLVGLYIEANGSGKNNNNRKAYIEDYLVWIRTVAAYAATKKAAISAASTKTILDAITWDFTTYSSSDPLVTSTHATEIT